MPRFGVVDAEHLDIRQSDQQLTHANRVDLHRGSPGSMTSDITDSVEPLSRARGPSAHYQTPPKSEEPDYS